MAVAHEIRTRLHNRGVHVPAEPERPPMDVAEAQVRLMAQRLSELAVELGVEFDFQLYPGSLVNPARSALRIGQAIAACAVAAESTAVVCGMQLPEILQPLPATHYDDTIARMLSLSTPVPR